MIRPNFLKISFTFVLFLQFHLLGFAQLSEEFCEELKDFGKFYENPDASILRSAKLFLSYQHQIGHIDGTDGVGRDFDDSFEEFRRFWVGLSGQFGNY